MPMGGGLVASCAAARRGLLANDYPESSYALPAIVRMGVHHAMAQPLTSRDRLLGVIAVVRPRGQPPFTVDDLAALESLAIQATVAVDNAALFIEAGRRRRFRHGFILATTAQLPCSRARSMADKARVASLHLLRRKSCACPSSRFAWSLATRSCARTTAARPAARPRRARCLPCARRRPRCGSCSWIRRRPHGA